jgi:hypothetical protein
LLCQSDISMAEEEKVKMEVEEEAEEPQDPLLALTDLVYRIQSDAFNQKEKAAAKKEIMAEIKKNGNICLLERLTIFPRDVLCMCDQRWRLTMSMSPASWGGRLTKNFSPG